MTENVTKFVPNSKSEKRIVLTNGIQGPHPRNYKLFTLLFFLSSFTSLPFVHFGGHFSFFHLSFICTRIFRTHRRHGASTKYAQGSNCRFHRYPV